MAFDKLERSLGRIHGLHLFADLAFFGRCSAFIRSIRTMRDLDALHLTVLALSPNTRNQNLFRTAEISSQRLCW
jgi:hypothetical protein